ncbi:hypothetical protein Pla163_36930 [Planctomycetes bacterium Pla163]|uniref:Uncharacterized protein n=1 Tax=Rohdeia mirabilis TaxID=2528008 RepID=A0A518D4Y6_9BACT|nr:hypothetical protein Pla163_36930 [Planctomycetes bacterium Pla163]
METDHESTEDERPRWTAGTWSVVTALGIAALIAIGIAVRRWPTPPIEGELVVEIERVEGNSVYYVVRNESFVRLGTSWHSWSELDPGHLVALDPDRELPNGFLCGNGMFLVSILLDPGESFHGTTEDWPGDRPMAIEVWMYELAPNAHRDAGTNPIVDVAVEIEDGARPIVVRSEPIGLAHVEPNGPAIESEDLAWTNWSGQRQVECRSASIVLTRVTGFTTDGFEREHHAANGLGTISDGVAFSVAVGAATVPPSAVVSIVLQDDGGSADTELERELRYAQLVAEAQESVGRSARYLGCTIDGTTRRAVFGGVQPNDFRAGLERIAQRYPQVAVSISEPAGEFAAARSDLLGGDSTSPRVPAIVDERRDAWWIERPFEATLRTTSVDDAKRLEAELRGAGWHVTTFFGTAKDPQRCTLYAERSSALDEPHIVELEETCAAHGARLEGWTAAFVPWDPTRCMPPEPTLADPPR